MKLRISESLKKATPYMLRNDDKLFELNKESSHPYVWGNFNSNLSDVFDNSLEQLYWVYKNTNNDYTKELIEKLMRYLVRFGYEDDVLIRSNDSWYITDLFGDDIEFTDSVDVTNDDAYDICDELEYEIGQEFCRVRMSDEYYGGSAKDIYFRISSDNFNWFDLIWKLVNDNKSSIDTVTISRDDGLTYELDSRTKFDHMPTDEFLTISGNPIIEGKQK